MQLAPPPSTPFRLAPLVAAGAASVLLFVGAIWLIARPARHACHCATRVVTVPAPPGVPRPHVYIGRDRVVISDGERRVFVGDGQVFIGGGLQLD